MSDEGEQQCTDVSISFQERCTLDEGHEGKHQARTATGSLHSWGNKFSLEPDPIDDSEEEPPHLDDGKRCGVRDGKNGGPCILDQEHDGHHSTGYRTFANKPPKAANASKQCLVEEYGIRCILPMRHTELHFDGKVKWSSPGKTKEIGEGKPKRAKVPSSPVDVGCPADSYGKCMLKRGHDGDHIRLEAMSGWTSVRTWNAIHERSSSAADAGASGWRACGSQLAVPKLACQRHTKHSGAHASLAPEGNHITRWQGPKPKGCDHTPITDFVAQLRADGSKAKATAKAKPEASPTATSTPTTTTSKAAPMTYSNNKRILGYRRHPAAAVWPMLEEEELKKLVDSIKARGLDEDVVLVNVDKETWILDGSNRARACEIAGIKPRFTKYIGKKDIDSLSDYVDARNDRRRHLSKSVRAMIAAEAAKLRHGERQTGSAAGLVTQGQAAKGKGVSERLVRKAVKVRDEATPKVKEAVMRGKLTVEAAEAATQLTHKQQDELADRALAKGGEEIKAGHVRSLVKQEAKRAVVDKINKEQVQPMPTGPFRLIVVDPPWPYENSDQHEGSRGHITYPPMQIPAICALNGEIARVAHDDVILGLWVTNAFVHVVGLVLTAWGFEHRTMLTWDKGRPGVGTWCRGQTEHLIIATKGNPTHTLNEISTLIRAPLREHSRKPDEVMELLEKHCPGPHLEMFAREPRPMWASWGAEPRKFVGAA